MQDDISGWSEWQPNFSKIEEISSFCLVTGRQDENDKVKK